MKNYGLSVIIAFYNKIDFLKLVFAGFERQSYKNFEVIVADDGSSADIVNQVKLMMARTSLEVQHIWQEDEGWRKNIMLNRAIKASKSEQLVFIDGDCIPHREFVAEYMKYQASNTILTGRRANLSERVTRQLTEQQVLDGKLEKMLVRMFIEGVSRKTQHMEKAIYVRSELVRKIIQSKESAILGCNFSMNKQDLLALNGFDERYLAPAVGEDTDLELRARNIGLKFKSVNHMAIQYHLYHRMLSRPTENMKILEENRKNKVGRTPYGIERQTQ